MDVLHPLTFAFPAMQYNVVGDAHHLLLRIAEKNARPPKGGRALRGDA
jgi:hypothetical protein